MITLLFSACGGGENSPEGIAKKWCDLNAKVHNASSDEERETARAAREQFEEQVEGQHKDDEHFMHEVKEAVEACEDASEGR